jgi:two-component system NarL family response regulator
MNNPPPIRLLLADDHAVVRMGLAELLNLEPDFRVVAEAEDAADAVAKYRSEQPDIAILDVRMTGGGVTALRDIRAEFPNARIVMLTTYDREEDIHAALTAGASAYLLKTIGRNELAHAIRQAHAGIRSIPPHVARLLEARRTSKQLTARELDVLRLMSKGLTNKEIGNILGCSEFTAKTHVKNILMKLQVSDRTEAVGAALQRGILAED